MSENPAPQLGVVVLAAGSSSRLGRNKLFVLHGNETFVHRTARLALALSPRDAVVVVGAGAEAVIHELRDLSIRCIECADWHDGMGASLRAGLASLDDDCDAALVVVCDQPALDATHLEALCSAWRTETQKAVASGYAGRHGVPAILPRTWFEKISGTADRGARGLFAGKPTDVLVVGNEPLAIDIDTPDDLAQFAPG